MNIVKDTLQYILFTCYCGILFACTLVVIGSFVSLSFLFSGSCSAYDISQSGFVSWPLIPPWWMRCTDLLPSLLPQVCVCVCVCVHVRARVCVCVYVWLWPQWRSIMAWLCEYSSPTCRIQTSPAVPRETKGDGGGGTSDPTSIILPPCEHIWPLTMAHHVITDHDGPERIQS